MPNWNLSTLMSEATSLIGNRQDVSLSRVSFWLNEANRQVYDFVNQESAEALAVSSTTSGENRITLPTDFREVINLSNTSVTPVDVLRQVDVDTIDSLTTVTGIPDRYVKFATWLELYPSPSSSFSLILRYRAQAADMVETTDVPSVDTQYRFGVLLKGVELLSDVILDTESAAMYRNKFIGYMSSVPSDLARKQVNREGMRVNFRRDER